MSYNPLTISFILPHVLRCLPPAQLIQCEQVCRVWFQTCDTLWPEVAHRYSRDVVGYHLSVREVRKLAIEQWHIEYPLIQWIVKRVPAEAWSQYQAESRYPVIALPLESPYVRGRRSTSKAFDALHLGKAPMKEPLATQHFAIEAFRLRLELGLTLHDRLWRINRGKIRLSDCLDDGELLDCRAVCRAWRQGIDQSPEWHQRLGEHPQIGQLSTRMWRCEGAAAHLFHLLDLQSLTRARAVCRGWCEAIVEQRALWDEKLRALGRLQGLAEFAKLARDQLPAAQIHLMGQLVEPVLEALEGISGTCLALRGVWYGSRPQGSTSRSSGFSRAERAQLSGPVGRVISRWAPVLGATRAVKAGLELRRRSQPEGVFSGEERNPFISPRARREFLETKPLDYILTCRAVCRAWRDSLDADALWWDAQIEARIAVIASYATWNQQTTCTYAPEWQKLHRRFEACCSQLEELPDWGWLHDDDLGPTKGVAKRLWRQTASGINTELAEFRRRRLPIMLRRSQWYVERALATSYQVNLWPIGPWKDEQQSNDLQAHRQDAALIVRSHARRAAAARPDLPQPDRCEFVEAFSSRGKRALDWAFFDICRELAQLRPLMLRSRARQIEQSLAKFQALPWQLSEVIHCLRRTLTGEGEPEEWIQLVQRFPKPLSAQLITSVGGLFNRVMKTKAFARALIYKNTLPLERWLANRDDIEDPNEVLRTADSVLNVLGRLEHVKATLLSGPLHTLARIEEALYCMQRYPALVALHLVDCELTPSRGFIAKKIECAILGHEPQQWRFFQEIGIEFLGNIAPHLVAGSPIGVAKCLPMIGAKLVWRQVREFDALERSLRPIAERLDAVPPPTSWLADPRTAPLELVRRGISVPELPASPVSRPIHPLIKCFSMLKAAGVWPRWKRTERGPLIISFAPEHRYQKEQCARMLTETSYLINEHQQKIVFESRPKTVERALATVFDADQDPGKGKGEADEE